MSSTTAAGAAASVASEAALGNTREFTTVDAAGDSQWFVEFMDLANALPDYALIRAGLADALEPLEGAHALDVGCGTGDDARELAQRVGPAGRVLGVDLSVAMVAEATARSAIHPGPPVGFRVADLRQLPFGDESFDATRAKLTLAHCEDPQTGLDELVRVTRVGGRIATFDYDFETLMVDHPDVETTRTVVRAWVTGHQNGWVGRQAARYFRACGLRHVTVLPRTVVMPFAFFERAVGGNVAHALPAVDLERWWAPLREAAAVHTFFAAQTGFVVAATR